MFSFYCIDFSVHFIKRKRTWSSHGLLGYQCFRGPYCLHL